MSQREHRIKPVKQTDFVLAVLFCGPQVVADKPFNLLANVVYILEHIFGRFTAISHLFKLHLHQPRNTRKLREYPIVLINKGFQRFAFDRLFRFNAGGD